MRRVIIAKPSELKKSRGFSNGTIRTWNGKKYQKKGGKWVRYSEGKRPSVGAAGEQKREQPKSSFTVSADSYDSVESLIASELEDRGAKVVTNDQGDFIIRMNGKKAILNSYDMDVDDIKDELSKIGYDLQVNPEDSDQFIIEDNKSAAKRALNNVNKLGNQLNQLISSFEKKKNREFKGV